MIIYEPLSCRYLDSTEEEIHNAIEQFSNRKNKISANEFLTKFKLNGCNLGEIEIFNAYGWDDYENLKNKVKIMYENGICELELTIKLIN